MPSNTFTINNVTRERYTRLAATAQKIFTEGDWQADSGNAASHGVRMSWVYDGNASTLTFTTLAKPFFVGYDMIESHLRDWVAGS